MLNSLLSKRHLEHKTITDLWNRVNLIPSDYYVFSLNRKEKKTQTHHHTYYLQPTSFSERNEWEIEKWNTILEYEILMKLQKLAAKTEK